MPRFLRIALTAWAFVIFFVGSPLIGVTLFPLLWITSKDRQTYRDRCTRLLQQGHRILIGWFSLSGLIGVRSLPRLPANLEGKPYILIANHPSLIDVILLLGWFDGLTCVVKGSWYRSWALGHLLSSTNYVAGPGSGREESADLLHTMVAHLEAGHPLLVFPEGTRSNPTHLRRFRRGAVEAAIRARVPIVSVFLSIDRPFLMKGVPFWHVPSDRARYRGELLSITDTSQTSPDSAKELNRELQNAFERHLHSVLALQADNPTIEAR